MRIELYSIDRLKKLLQQDTLWKGPRIAISRNRALSAIHNPRAQSDDVVLAAAFEGDTLVAYHGALPDTLYANNKAERFAWGSCWWVDDALRGQRLGSILKEKLIACWQQRFASRDVSPDALKSLKKSGLALEFKQEPGIDFCFDNALLRNKAEDMDICRWDKQATLPKGYRIEYVSQLDAVARQFIDEQQRGELFRRGADELNWISLYPWCSQEPPCNLETVQQAYFFDLKYARFFNLFVKVIDDSGNIVCLCMFLICNQRLSAPYVYYKPDSLEMLSTVIGKHIVHLGIENFRTHNTALLHSMQSFGPPAKDLKPVQRSTLFSPEMSSLPDTTGVLQDGDGDCAFWA